MENSEEKSNKGDISILGIFEICILVLGVGMSVTSTIKPLKYTLDYLWCFAFTLLGMVLIVPLILLIKKRYVWLIGALFILFYIYVGGFGAFICELNYSRLHRVSFFEGKQILAEMGGRTYRWDGRSVSYNDENLNYLNNLRNYEDDIILFIDGEETENMLYDSSVDENLYMQIYGGGTGIFLILKPME